MFRFAARAGWSRFRPAGRVTFASRGKSKQKRWPLDTGLFDLLQWWFIGGQIESSFRVFVADCESALRPSWAPHFLCLRKESKQRNAAPPSGFSRCENFPPSGSALGARHDGTSCPIVPCSASLPSIPRRTACTRPAEGAVWRARLNLLGKSKIEYSFSSDFQTTPDRPFEQAERNRCGRG